MNDDTRLPGRDQFLSPLLPFLTTRELEHIGTAYLFSKYGHRGQARDGGGRYFDHPKSVAAILIDELRITDWRMITAALLHDILEDSWILTEERLHRNFGRTVTLWIKFLTKRPKDGYHERLMRFASWQPIAIKLCDRLHNMRTLHDCVHEKRSRQLVETRQLYIPLARRLVDLLPPKDRWRAHYLEQQLDAICTEHERLLTDQPPPE